MSSDTSIEMPGVSPAGTAEARPGTPPRRGRRISAPVANAIENHMKELESLRRFSEGKIVGDDHGTVLAVVQFPKQDKPALACDGRLWKDIQIRMRHDKLMDLGSKKIADMFTAKAQERILRRLGFQNGLPPGIEYILDFTPPPEGAELADLTAALWLPRVVKLWFLAGHYIPDSILANGFGLPSRPLADKAVGATLALGHDDDCRNLGCVSDDDEWGIKPDVPGIIEDSPDRPSHIPGWRKVEDYCPIRHRVAIARVLRAINGEDILLNSAVRMWTVARVAISLDVPQVVVDPVAQWLSAPPNTKFIEICPEKAFQLAYELKIPGVLITAFKILVSELAVDYASSEPVTRPPPMTWAQRRRDDYGDYPFDPVQYASRAFAERMEQTVEALQSDRVISWLPGINPEWDKLQAYSKALPDGHPLRKACGDLKTALVAALHEWVDQAFKPYPTIDSPGDRRSDLLEAQRSHYIPSAECKPIRSLYAALNRTQRALTPFFWERISWLPSRTNFFNAPYHGKAAPKHARHFNHLLDFFSASETDPAYSTLCEAATSCQNSSVHFDIDRFYEYLCHQVRELGGIHLASNPYGVPDSEQDTIQLFLSDHLLLSLSEKELNYLPIWANGLDDGTGGVFQEALPPAEMGPSEPGPGYHTGYTVGTETEMDTATEGGDGALSMFGLTHDGRSITEGREEEEEEADGPPPPLASTVYAPSDLGVGNLRLGSEKTAEWVSTTAAATVSTTTVGAAAAAATTTTTTAAAAVGRNTDVQRRSGGGGGVTTTTTSGSFTAGDEEMECTYADARYAQPAAHQAQGQALEMYVNDAGTDDGISSSFEAFLDDDYDDGLEDLEMDDGSSTLDGFEEIDVEETR